MFAHNLEKMEGWLYTGIIGLQIEQILKGEIYTINKPYFSLIRKLHRP
jgi:hypothetical protein